MKNWNYLFFILFVVNCFSATAQQLHDYGFVKDISIPVYAENQVKYPWTGGMNSMQFAWLDCNFDGIKDLIAFDAQGNRILPFFKTSNGKYEYAPQYAHYFPALNGFMQLIDFNNDGKEDIFTYGLAGIKVYENISDTELKFELFDEQLKSVYLPGQQAVNLFCTSGDYLIIKDMDGDGDLDILAFSALGKYVHYHKNISMEKYGNLKHLEFEIVDWCWGRFSENGEYNAIMFNDTCAEERTKAHRHTGSTMLLFDENNNGLPDLVLGDMDYPTLMLLTNGGSADEAYMVAKDSLFPSDNVPVNLYSMPCPMLLDVDDDGKEDLLVSPLDIRLTKSENKESVWFYKNTGTQNQPYFSLQTKSFLQEDMLDFGSGAYPVLYDMNGDGLLDLLVGNYGYYDSTTSNGYAITCYYSASLAYFKNTGTNILPEFSLVTEDLGGLRQLGYTAFVPSVGDLNEDGKPDILLGTAGNNLIYLENNSSSQDTLTFAIPIYNYQSLIMPEYAAAQLFDLDKDALLDLIVGDRRGIMSFYKNTGTSTSPVFTHQRDTLGKINVQDPDESFFGYATPCFFRTNSGETRLFIASEKGDIAYYKNIDENLEGKFDVELNKLFFVDNNKGYSIKEGVRTAVAVGDLNNDDYPDLLVGNFAGGLSFYKGIVPPDRNINIIPVKEFAPEQVSIELFPNPTNGQLHFKIVSGEKFVSVAVFDILGVCKLRTDLKNKDFIDLSALTSGMYLVRFISKDGFSASKKIIKQ